jgi:hypothetical protein
MPDVFQNIDPPPPTLLNPASVSSPRTKDGGRGVHNRQAVRGRGVNNLEAARHWIGLLQYNPSTLGRYKSPPRSNKWRHPHVCRCPLAGTAPNYIHLNTATKISSTSPQCMSPRRNWDSTNPSPASECALPSPWTTGWGGGHTRLRVYKVVGEFLFRRLEKKLSTLPTLCSTYYNFSQEESVLISVSTFLSYFCLHLFLSCFLFDNVSAPTLCKKCLTAI